ncbi:MAG: hypothetical protein Fur005_15050 [Roseiflexaceae bacterium]
MSEQKPIPEWAQRVEQAVRWGLQHWLLFANALVFTYAIGPWLSPLAYASGMPTLGRILFLIYRPFCHQIPERSFFIYGYQVAYCHRETAMYTVLFALGLLFALVRNQLPVISLRIGGLLLLPILLDGGTHMIDDLLKIGFRGGGDEPGSLNFWMRMITGSLFAVAVVLTIYPRMERDLRKAGLLA